MTNTWSTDLISIESLGKQYGGPGSLAGLHQARKEHLSQFFTPDSVTNLIWSIANPVMDKAISHIPGSKVAIIDNSVGSGRMLAKADPQKHYLAGFDIQQDTISALMDAATKASFDCDFVCSPMEAIKEPRRFGVAMINPPFSITLDSPVLTPTHAPLGVTTGKIVAPLVSSTLYTRR